MSGYPKWEVFVGDLLDQTADAFLCTANPWLNMTGGVNGAILGRGNVEIQRELHAFLAKQPKKFVPPATIVETSPGNLSTKHIFHCVSIDGFYHSSSALVTQTVEAALTKAAQRDCETIVMPTLATGYGPLNMTQFANGLRPLLDRSFGPIRHIGIYVLRPEHQAEIEGVLFS